VREHASEQLRLSFQLKGGLGLILRERRLRRQKISANQESTSAAKRKAGESSPEALAWKKKQKEDSRAAPAAREQASWLLELKKRADPVGGASKAYDGLENNVLQNGEKQKKGS
jgi:hypothetical protein